MKENIEYANVRVGGNPYDVIMEAAIGYLRCQLFAIGRIGTAIEEPDKGQHFVDRINEQYKLLNALEEEDRENLRRCCVHGQYCRSHNKLNNFLFRLEQSCRTIYCETNPALDPVTDKLFKGEYSSEVYAQNAQKEFIVDLMAKLEIGFEKVESLIEDYMNAIDPVFNRPPLDPDIEKRLNDAIEIFGKYNFSMDDLEYMRSFVRHKIDDEHGITVALFDAMINQDESK